jgi:hypothetical protein
MKAATRGSRRPDRSARTSALVGTAGRGDQTDRLIARLAGDPLGPLARHPPRRLDAQVVRQRDHNARSQAGRQQRTLKQRLAHGGFAAEAGEDATEHFGRDIDLGIADERQDRIEPARLGKRGDCAAWQVGPARQRRLGDDVSASRARDEVGVGQHRRALKHGGGHVRFVVGCQREDQRTRRIAGEAQSFRQRPANRDKRVVQQRRHRQHRLGAEGRRKIGVEIGARERARALGARLPVGALRPGEKSAHNIALSEVWPGERERWEQFGHRSVGVQGALPCPSWR